MNSENNNEKKHGPLRDKEPGSKGPLIFQSIPNRNVRPTREPEHLPENRGDTENDNFIYTNNDIPVSDFSAYFGGSPENNRNWRKK